MKVRFSNGTWVDSEMVAGITSLAVGAGPCLLVLKESRDVLSVTESSDEAAEVLGWSDWGCSKKGKIVERACLASLDTSAVQGLASDLARSILEVLRA